MAGPIQPNSPQEVDGAAVAARTIELGGAQACQYQSILERSLSVTGNSVRSK